MTLRLRPVLSHSLTALLCASALVLIPLPAWADNVQEATRLLKQGQLGAALEKTEQTLATKPKDAQARFLKGLILTEMGKQNDAITVFTKLTEDYPELPEPYNNLAVLYAQQRQFEKAKNALEMAIRTHPSYATAHENLGDIYARMASQAYDKALQIDSSNASAQTKLSMIRDLMSVSARPATLAARTPPAKSTATPTPPPATKTEAAPLAKAEPASAAKAEPAPVAKAETAMPTSSATDPKQASEGKAEVEKAVRDWAAAWSRKDVKAYLAAYARDFQTPGGEARDTWEAERTRRINKPEPIQVGVENLQVTFEGDRATAKFRQNYKSGKLKTAASKTMVFVKSDGRWLIQQERVGN